MTPVRTAAATVRTAVVAAKRTEGERAALGTGWLMEQEVHTCWATARKGSTSQAKR